MTALAAVAMNSSPSFPPQIWSRPRSASIVINNFNYARFLGRAIDSALAQTTAAQVVVVDDGSSDDSREVISRYGGAVTALFAKHQGQSGAINVGFRVATGDIVVFLDADDTLHPNLVETLLAQWRTNVVMVQYPLEIIDAAEVVVGIYPDPPSRLSEGDVRSELLSTGSFGRTVTSGLAFHRNSLASVMPLPAAKIPLCADGYLLRAMAFRGPLQRLTVPLGSYRDHGENLSGVGSTPDSVARGLREKVHYATQELDFTRQLAGAYGMRAAPDIGMRDADFLGFRLFLRLVDPSSRDVGAPSTPALLLSYIQARWASPWSFTRRLLVVVVAMVAAISPRAIAARLLLWLHVPTTRPLSWLGAALRRRRAERSSV